MQTTHTTYKCTFCIKQKSAQHLILIEYDTNTNQYKLFFSEKGPMEQTRGDVTLALYGTLFLIYPAMRSELYWLLSSGV